MVIASDGSGNGSDGSGNGGSGSGSGSSSDMLSDVCNHATYGCVYTICACVSAFVCERRGFIYIYIVIYIIIVYCYFLCGVLSYHPGT